MNNQAHQEKVYPVKEIVPRSAFSMKVFGEIFRYRDLLFLFVRRDFVSTYKQTILGIFWHFVQPALTTITFTFIFGRIAQFPTNGIPGPLFYMSGIMVWFVFSENVKRSSNVFVSNIHIFSKVYFPRLIMPLSAFVNSFISFLIQLILFFSFYIYYRVGQGVEMDLGLEVLPLLLLLVFFGGLIGMSIGMIVSSATIKYRDLSYFVGFAVQLLMYFSPVIYPLSSVKENMRWIIELNPMTPVIECFRYVFLGKGMVEPMMVVQTCLVGCLIFCLGLFMFNRAERNFTDTL